MSTKIAICCSSNPDTGKTRVVRFTRSRQLVGVCDNLENDGSCGGYIDRPEPCKAYVCPKIYEMGLDSSGQ
jgi:hypothetical protein